MGSSQTRARTHVPCLGRQILNHCATREVPCVLCFKGENCFIDKTLEFSITGEKSSPQPSWPGYSEWSRLPAPGPPHRNSGTGLTTETLTSPYRHLAPIGSQSSPPLQWTFTVSTAQINSSFPENLSSTSCTNQVVLMEAPSHSVSLPGQRMSMFPSGPILVLHCPWPQ